MTNIKIFLIFSLAILWLLFIHDVTTDEKYSHKFKKNDCISFQMYDWNYEKNSSGEEIGNGRIEYVRYDKMGAYYGIKIINMKNNIPSFVYHRNRLPIGIIRANVLDLLNRLQYVHHFSWPEENNKRNNIYCKPIK